MDGMRFKPFRRKLRATGVWKSIRDAMKPHRNRDRILGDHRRWSDLGAWVAIHGELPRDVLGYLAAAQYAGVEFACDRRLQLK